MPLVDILIPTYNRLTSLLLTISGVAAQTLKDVHVVVSDQSDTPVAEDPVVRTLSRIIEARGGSTEWHYHAPSRGIAEQRNFLLTCAKSKYVLYLDDDVFMEPCVVERLYSVIETQGCGFTGAFPAGLSFFNDVRPEQQSIEFWEGPVQPEAIEPTSPEWRRAQLHRAANAFHVSRSIPSGEHRLYKVAWIASCVLYDREKLIDVGGFSFWNRLPRYHSGEEVLVQNLLMRLWGGCAILPSGTYHTEMESTVLNSTGTVDGHALSLLPEMVERYVTSREALR
jgi:glycosyltransferase involved in cell wall biosynthesis